MCGIAGSINSIIEEKTLELIRHRGPDFQALIEEEVDQARVFLGHTRLSILDLSEAGNQPMYTDCGNYCMVFNGEIYNHLELRKKLPGIQFKGHSDTETILYYIREFGIESIRDFNGIFAFGLLDKVHKKLYLARDHFGVKPLYYFQKGDQLVFGSELKIILANRAYQKELNIPALNTLLSFRYNPAPETIFKNIHKLKAAHYVTCDFKGTSQEVNYWKTRQQINHKIGKQEAMEEYRRLLEQAVKRQLLSDVPVGLLLSGGLDSAVLGYLMAKHTSAAVQSFTIGFEGKGDFNETKYARETAGLIHSEHREILINKEIYLEGFNSSFYHVEEPIAEPTIPALLNVSALASRHVKVVMSGQGIDEPMAGYNRYWGEYLFSRYSKILPFIPVGLLARIFPRNHTIARASHALNYKGDLDRFIGIYTLFTPELKNELYCSAIASYASVDERHYFEEAFLQADATGGSLSKMLYVDTRTMLPDDLLLFNDKITMANSIENRVPYLDIDLVNFIETLPASMKRQGKNGKYLHKEAVKEWIPDSIINRKKRGFSTPVDGWFQQELSQTLESLITDNNSLSQSYFNIAALKRIISDHKTKKHNYKHELFILLSLELWYKNFYKQF